MAQKEHRNRATSTWSHAAWSFPGVVDRMLFARSAAAELASSGVQKVVHMPGWNTDGAMDDDGIADLQGQAAVIGVHEAWF